MLAQQIKEELNTFKMVCRCLVHLCWPLPTRADLCYVGDGGSRKLQDLHTLLLTTATLMARNLDKFYFTS
jgi:hypothetical protein